MWHGEKETLDLLDKYQKRKDDPFDLKRDRNKNESNSSFKSSGQFNIKKDQKSEEEKINLENYEYASFVDRIIASLLDTIILLVPIGIIEFSFILNTGNIFSTSLFFEIIIPFLITIVFWTQKGATPGKIIMKMLIIDENTKNGLSAGQSIIRYIGYFPSMMIFGLGLIWIAIDNKNQGWHDKMANTIVIKEKRNNKIE